MPIGLFDTKLLSKMGVPVSDGDTLSEVLAPVYLDESDLAWPGLDLGLWKLNILQRKSMSLSKADM